MSAESVILHVRCANCDGAVELDARRDRLITVLNKRGPAETGPRSAHSA